VEVWVDEDLPINLMKYQSALEVVIGDIRQTRHLSDDVIPSAVRPVAAYLVGPPCGCPRFRKLADVVDVLNRVFQFIAIIP
jgi:hypothetical protein